MTAYANDYLALRALATRLTTVFTVTNAATYTSYGGVDVVMARDEDTEEERSGKPYLLIDLQSGDMSEWSAGASQWRTVTATVAACADDSSGAQYGTANSVTSPELMSRDLVAEFQTNYTTWRGLGLHGIEISADRATTPADTPGATVIPHRVIFQYELS